MAKGLGFSFLFGLLPLLFLTVSLAGYLYRVLPGMQKFVTEEFLNFIPAAARQALLSHITTAAGNWGAIGILGIIILLGIALALFDSLERAFATMLSAPRRKFHFGRLISLALMAGAVLLFFGAAALSTTASYFRNVWSLPPAVVYWGGKVISGLMIAFILLGLYYLFARRRLRFWPTLGIALFASLLWQLIGVAGSTVIRYAGRRVIVWGALAWVTIFLIYLRVLAELILFSSLLVSRASPPRETE
jgi:membrane protein